MSFSIFLYTKICLFKNQFLLYLKYLKALKNTLFFAEKSIDKLIIFHTYFYINNAAKAQI